MGYHQGPLASFIIASYERPGLLGATRRAIQESVIPDGWRMEIVVAGCLRGEPYLERNGIRAPLAKGVKTDVGSMQTRALGYSRGELILVSGDDDLSSPHRLAESVKAYKAGARMMGLRSFRFVEIPTGACATWRGNPWRAGSGMAYARKLLEDANGWGECPIHGDARLHERLRAAGYSDEETVDLPPYVGEETAFLSHTVNLSGRRPFPDKQKKQRLGSFLLYGEGHYQGLAWPAHTRKILDDLCNGSHPYP